MGDIVKGHQNTSDDCLIMDSTDIKSCSSKTLHAYSTFILSQFDRLRKREELCDVTLIVGGESFKAHKAILSAASPYFYAMFTSHMDESRKSQIEIHDISAQAMNIILEFIYTYNEIVVNECNVQTLLPAACLFQLDQVQKVCEQFLLNQLDSGNCLGIRAFADLHSCHDLYDIADRFVHNTFEEVMLKEEYLLLPLDQLIEIISSDDLNVRYEEIVFQAVMLWIKYDLPQRQKYLYEILKHVRFPVMKAPFLVSCVGTEPLIKSCLACRDLIDEAKDYLLLRQPVNYNYHKNCEVHSYNCNNFTIKPKNSDEFKNDETHGKEKQNLLLRAKRLNPRKGQQRKHREILYVAGGWCHGDALSTLERFDGQNWALCAPMHKRRCGVGIGVLNGFLYAVGGHDGTSYLNSVERYDPNTDVWYCDVEPTSTCRTSVGVCVNYACGQLYVVGGQDGVACLNIVESYNANTNKWTRLAPMRTRRLGVAVAFLGPFLYAIGGADGTTPLNTVERYDPRRNRWTGVASMHKKRKHLGAVPHNGFIYAVGGRDETSELDCVERYDPNTNTWSMLPSMNSRRSGVGLAVIMDHLIAVGGFDGRTYLKTIEILNTNTLNGLITTESFESHQSNNLSQSSFNMDNSNENTSLRNDNSIPCLLNVTPNNDLIPLQQQSNFSLIPNTLTYDTNANANSTNINVNGWKLHSAVMSSRRLGGGVGVIVCQTPDLENEIDILKTLQDIGPTNQNTTFYYPPNNTFISNANSNCRFKTQDLNNSNIENTVLINEKVGNMNDNETVEPKPQQSNSHQVLSCFQEPSLSNNHLVLDNKLLNFPSNSPLKINTNDSTHNISEKTDLGPGTSQFTSNILTHSNRHQIQSKYYPPRLHETPIMKNKPKNTIYLNNQPDMINKSMANKNIGGSLLLNSNAPNIIIETTTTTAAATTNVQALHMPSSADPLSTLSLIGHSDHVMSRDPSTNNIEPDTEMSDDDSFISDDNENTMSYSSSSVYS